MTAEEIAELLINGNITAAREAIAGGPHRNVQRDAAIRALDVLEEMIGWDDPALPVLLRLRNCLTGEPS